MLSPLPANRWTYETAAHLLNRAAFGGTPADIEKLYKMGPEAAVASLVEYDQVADTNPPPPDWAKPDPEQMERQRQMRMMSEPEKKAKQAEERREQGRRLISLRAWWVDRMANGSRPFQEKMTLFWHGHFATSMQKVKDAYLMYLQNETFRKYAVGSWRKMLVAVSQDPAMLVWLDNAKSNRKQPNENYAREVMELFSLGEGHYTEDDVRDAARAFTGWTLGPDRQSFMDKPFLHDDGDKKFLGSTGPLTGEDVISRIVKQPQAARFITARLWTFFATQEPSEETITAMSKVLTDNEMKFQPFMKALLLSEEFYSPVVMRQQVKSPVQWLVGTVKMMETKLPEPPVITSILNKLGQNLFAPPNVKGWDGGIAWISTNYLLNRYNMAGALVEGNEVDLQGQGKGIGGNVKRLLKRFGVEAGNVFKPATVDGLFTRKELATRESLFVALQKRFLQGELKADRARALREYMNGMTELGPNEVRDSIRLLMSTPDYQIV